MNKIDIKSDMQTSLKEIEEKQALIKQWEEYASVFPSAYVNSHLSKPSINNTISEIKFLISNIQEKSNALKEAQKKGTDVKITSIGGKIVEVEKQSTSSVVEYENNNLVIKDKDSKLVITDELDYNRNDGEQIIIEKVENNKIEQLKTEVKSGLATKESINNIISDEDLYNLLSNNEYEDIFENDTLDFLTQIVNSSKKSDKEKVKDMEERMRNELENNYYQAAAKNKNTSSENAIIGSLLQQSYNKEKGNYQVDAMKTDIPYYERYYCGADVQIWVNDKWFDNVASFQYALTNNKSPVYGYFSEEFDAVARGTRLVQGQIGVALTDIQEFNNKCLGGLNIIDKNAYTTINEYDKYVGIGFTIGIYLGDSLPGEEDISKHRSGTYLKIKDCHITNHALYCDTSENPIMIVYNFFARNYDPGLEKLDVIGLDSSYDDKLKESKRSNEENILREMEILKLKDRYAKLLKELEDKYRDINSKNIQNEIGINAK